jgi:hypothetical protein
MAEEKKSDVDKPRQAVAKKSPSKETARVHTWPHLIRLEFLVIIFLTAGLIFWSITVNAPLEEIAQPSKTPNPSKAPWYFLGLQEMLVYFDPWIAGVLLPSLIIVGLLAIPYLDINPKGSGYYTFKERPYAVSGFLFGFVGLWTMLIMVGTFLRGPGWNLFWPWEVWDPHKVVALTNVDLPYLIGIRDYNAAMLFGGLVIGGFYSLGILFYVYLKLKKSPLIEQLGLVRYGTLAFLLLTMAGLPLKMLLRLLFNVKYILVTPWFNI